VARSPFPGRGLIPSVESRGRVGVTAERDIAGGHRDRATARHARTAPVSPAPWLASISVATAGTPVGPFPPGTEPDEYDRLRRRILWMLPSGLYLLGSRAGGVDNLMTLNWATQVSFDPKSIAVSVEQGALTHRLVDEGGTFALSILHRSDVAVVRRFVKPAQVGPGPSELNGFAIHRATTQSPILAQAAAWLDCRVAQRVVVGGHTVFIGEVVDAGRGPVVDDASSQDEGVLRMEDTRMNYGG
jgi:flavin reductase (DIM6/NTAB) family NADH-FMN oxidoreductase RutF